MRKRAHGFPDTLSRRDVLKLGVGTAGMAALGGVDGLALSPAAAQSGAFDWKRFKGEKIEVSLVKNDRSNVLQKYEKEFEELTGIKVGSEQIPEQQHRQKQVIEFTSGRTSFDVTFVSWHVQKRLFGKAKWMEDLRGYLKDPTLTAPDYDWNDFSKASVDFATQADGRIDTLPLIIDYWILYWNKELFQAKGVSFPKTLDEMLEAARRLHDPANRVYGFVARGLKNANTPVWTGFLLGWDVDSVDEKGQLHTDEPEAVAAAELYKKILKDYAPPGVSGFNWNECQTLFMQGNAAMWYDGIGFAPPLEDRTKSRVVGKVGYGMTPAGPKRQHAGVTGTGIGVSAFTNKKGPAYFYCQWATNKLNQLRMLETGAGAPCRDSAYRDPRGMANLKVPKEWAEALVECGKIGRPQLPVIIPVTEFRDVFGIALTNMIGGADPAAELKKATEQFRPVLEKSEKG